MKKTVVLEFAADTFRKCVRVVFILMVMSSVAFASTPTEIENWAKSVLKLEVVDANNDVFAMGSGFVAYNQSTLVTNYHVIEDADHIIAYSDDGESYLLSNIQAFDEEKDIAILKFDYPTRLMPLVLDTDAFPLRGEPVIAIGSPVGLKNTVSLGNVSAVYEDSNNIAIVQFTAPISHGSRGGALLNENGEVIGITTAYYSEGQNLNIAISAQEIQLVWETKDDKDTPIRKKYPFLQIASNPSLLYTDKKYYFLDGRIVFHLPKNFQLLFEGEIGQYTTFEKRNEKQERTGAIAFLANSTQFDPLKNLNQKESIYDQIELQIEDFIAGADAMVYDVTSERSLKPFGVVFKCFLHYNSPQIEMTDCYFRAFCGYINDYQLFLVYFEGEDNKEQTDSFFYSLVTGINENASQNTVKAAEVKIRDSGAVNVRAEPSSKSTIIGVARSGGLYTYIRTAENGWYKIRLEDGKEGYVSNKLSTLITK